MIIIIILSSLQLSYIGTIRMQGLTSKISQRDGALLVDNCDYIAHSVYGQLSSWQFRERAGQAISYSRIAGVYITCSFH